MQISQVPEIKPYYNQKSQRLKQNERFKWYLKLTHKNNFEGYKKMNQNQENNSRISLNCY